MKRFFPVSLLLLCALSGSARVLSYAPYSDALAARGDQRRDTRHFVLIETEPYDFRVRYGQVVLYDSKGVEAPRVIFPRGTIHFAALFQDGERPPVILVAAGSPVATHISRNGGRSWRQIKELDGLVPHAPTDLDYGGPWTLGLSSSVRIGTIAFPFVVSYRGGVYAIPRTGAPKLLVRTPNTNRNCLIGQNRQGTEFVILTDPHAFAAITLDGKGRYLGEPLDDMDAAWITPDGSVYAVTHEPVTEYDEEEPQTRALHLYRDRRAEEVVASTSKLVIIPTYDFSGAWISKITRGWYTELFRHQPGGKLQRELLAPAIDDRPEPEIEALHAGPSGKTLLLQVHRKRAQQAAFLDPALAVWRIGDPAPAEYDELFLKEGPYKGFVHLDVDAMAAGEPFVFDSSFLRPPPPEPVSSPISGGDDILQEWGVVRASLVQRLVLSGAIRTPGEWRTDLLIYNPLATAQKVDVVFDGATKRVTVDPHTIRVVDDALLSLFGIDDGSGTLQFIPETGVNVKARVYALRGGGTRGYVAGPVDFYNVISPRFPATFSGAFPGTGFRTRLLLTDTTGRGVKADVTTIGAAGVVGIESVSAANLIENDAWSSTPGGLIVRPTGGMDIAAVVTVDERSGDATYFSPDVPANEWRTIPFVVHAEEPDGSLLRTDLQLLNPSATARTISIEVKPYDTAQWPRIQSYTLKAYESRVIHDPLKTLFNLTGTARLRYASSWNASDTSGVRLTARAYRTAADGGTSGTLVPPMNNFQSVTVDESLEILAPVGTLRVSLGLVELSANPRGNPTRVRVTTFDERSVKLGSFEVTLPMSNGAVTPVDLGSSPPAAARFVIEPLDDVGLVSAYALLTDPVTGDTSFVAPALGAKK